MARTAPNISLLTVENVRLVLKDIYSVLSSHEANIGALQKKEPDSVPVSQGVDGNIALFGTKPNFQGSDRVAFIENAYTAPVAAPAGGVFLYSQGGYLKARDAGGIVSIGGATQVAYKTTDETVNNSATLQDDNHLTVAVLASSVYAFRLALFGTESASTSPGIKLNFTAPTGAAGSLIYTAMSTGVTAFVGGGTVWGNYPLAIENTDVWANWGITTTLFVDGIITTSSTAGTLTLQWAQFESHASGTTLYKGSSLTLIKQ